MQLSSGTAQHVPAPFSGPAVTPVGAYLQSLTVSGFRGIGAPSVLEVHPGLG